MPVLIASLATGMSSGKGTTEKNGAHASQGDLTRRTVSWKPSEQQEQWERWLRERKGEKEGERGGSCWPSRRWGSG